MNNRRQEILDFLRDKNRDEVEEYAQANGLETHNCSRDRMENQIADLLSNKYIRANGRQSAMSPRSSKFMANGKSPRNLEWQNQVRSAVQSGQASNTRDAIKKMSQSNGNNYDWKGKISKFSMSNGHTDDEIDQMAQDTVMKISGDNTLTSVSEWAEAVRYLVGKKLSNGRTITAVQATQSLKPYYVSQNNNSNGYQMKKYINANGCHNEGVCSADSNDRKYQNSNGRKSPRSLKEVLADSGVNLNDEDKSANKWLMTIKDCTNKTGLDAVECSAILSKEDNNSPYKEEVIASARRKIQVRSPK